MKSRKFLWFLLRLNLIVWLATAIASVYFSDGEAAKPEKVEFCHFGTTMELPAKPAEKHLAHGDYLGECVVGTIPEVVPDPRPYPLYMMWLLTRDKRLSVLHGEVVIYPAYWQCLIRSDTHPSIERQGALCFPSIFNGTWVADDTPCAANVMSDGSWRCDKYTPWRLR